MFNPSNSLNDPARVSRRDYMPQDGKTDTSYRYQTTAQSKGDIPAQKVPDSVKHILSYSKLNKR
jgi:hypothetical protein